ncbi:histidine triad nucleotide-binding protein [Candidatus Neomarinimicrobiota bacterium]
MSETLFTRIINKEIPAEIIHEDEWCIAFRDVNPQAPVHFLVVPRKPVPRLQDISADDAATIGHIHSVITRLSVSEGIEDGYRVVVNNGETAGQSVFHLHFHVMGGRGFAWPPG